MYWLTMQNEMQLTCNVIHLTLLVSITDPNWHLSIPIMHGGGEVGVRRFRPPYTIQFANLLFNHFTLRSSWAGNWRLAEVSVGRNIQIGVRILILLPNRGWTVIIALQNISFHPVHGRPKSYLPTLLYNSIIYIEYR